MDKIGNYTILKKIAAGGMAEVYLAKSTLRQNIEKFFAIKCLKAEFLCKKDYIDLFVNEARVQVNMNHSNVVSIYDFGVKDANFFIAMEYVNGATLRSLYRGCLEEETSLQLSEIVYAMKEVAQGLQHAHTCVDTKTGKKIEIIHGDVSPDNIMVTVDGEIKVIDFGVSKQIDAERTLVAGKQRYMSDRQLKGRELNVQSDIYALGRTFLELLRASLGFKPHLNKHEHLNDLVEIEEHLDLEVYTFLKRMLIQDSHLAYKVMEDLAADLSVFLNTNFPAFNKKQLGEKLQKYSDHSLLVDHLDSLSDDLEADVVDMDYTFVTMDQTHVQSRDHQKPKRKKVRRRRRVFRKKVS